MEQSREATSEGDVPRPLGFIDARARGEFARIGLATFLIYFLNAQGTMLAIVFRSHGMSLPDVGLLLSLFAIPVVVVTFLSGPVMARIGALAAARLGMGVVTIGFVSLAATSSSFWPALASRLVQGAGFGLVLAPLMTYAQGRLTQERFVYLLGIMSSTAPLAQAFGPSWAEYVFRAHGDAALFLGAGIPAVAGILLTFGLRPLERPKTKLGAGFGAALRRDRLLPLATIFVSGSLFGFLGAYMAPALADKSVPLGWFFTASTAAMLASRLLAFRFIEQLDRRLLVAAGLGLMATAFLLVAASDNRASIAAAGVMFGFGYSVVYPLVSAWMSAGLPSSERSGPQAIFNAIFSIGLLGTPYPVTFIIAAEGYGAALRVLAVFGLAMAAILVSARLRQSFEMSRQAERET
jgi:MFS family permease